MACLLAPMAEAIVVTVVKHVVKKKEKRQESGVTPSVSLPQKTGYSWSRKLSWLNQMLWGGVALLILEHVWHGEIVPWPPFLTAMNSPESTAVMLEEIATVGGAMVVFVTLVWFVVVMIADRRALSAARNASSLI